MHQQDVVSKSIMSSRVQEKRVLLALEHYSVLATRDALAAQPGDIGPKRCPASLAYTRIEAQYLKRSDMLPRNYQRMQRTFCEGQIREKTKDFEPHIRGPITGVDNTSKQSTRLQAQSFI